MAKQSAGDSLVSDASTGGTVSGATELMVWIALRRVNEGGVALLDGFFYHHGRVVPCYLNAPLTELVDTGLLSLADANLDEAGMRRVMITENGREWYEVLCGKRGVSSDSPTGACRGEADQVRSRVVGPSIPSSWHGSCYR